MSRPPDNAERGRANGPVPSDRECRTSESLPAAYADQPSLLDLIPQDGCRRPRTIGERFEEFHRRNPHVYAALVDIARDLVRRGHRKVGIGMAYEVARWQLMIQTDTDDDFRLNNDFRSRYARLIQAQEPDLADVFEVRELRSA